MFLMESIKRRRDPLTRLIGPKKESSPSHLVGKTFYHEGEEVLHLKRLLVSLKQQYEKNLEILSRQLQGEIEQKATTQKELGKVNLELQKRQQHYEEEILSLTQQQAALKGLLKKTQEEFKLSRDEQSAPPPIDQTEALENQQRIEQLEEQISSLREQSDGANLKAEQLKEELEGAQKRIKLLQAELANEHHTHQRKLEEYQQSITYYEQAEAPNLSNVGPLRQELELIRQTLAKGSNETKALDARYVETLNEKISLEHHLKQLQLQLEHQSSNLAAFHEQLKEVDQTKKELETTLKSNEKRLKEKQNQYELLETQIEEWKAFKSEKERADDRYEQLKDEFVQLSERLEEALDGRLKAESEMHDLQELANRQELLTQEQAHQLSDLIQEKEHLSRDLEQLRHFFDESEARLKVAQQHLAKKVKEATLLTHKVDEQQNDLTTHQQIIESLKIQIGQSQTNIDLYQKQEKRLQEQLHEALKSTESQVAKWEEKYFRMYDKWQESEGRIRELKKFEEKHLQMQNLLSNLGTFMGSSSAALFHQVQDQPKGHFIETANENSSLPLSAHDNSAPDKFDLFNAKAVQDKLKTNLFS